MDNRRALRIANGYFAGLLGAVGDGDWELPTPCEEWSVRDLVRHVVSGHIALVSALSGEEFDDGPGEEFGPWAARAQGVAEMPGVSERTVRHPQFGELSGDALVMIRWGDVCVHAWDLAQAIGADFEPDPQLADAALEWLVPFAPGLSATGVFAPAADPSPGTDSFARVLALTGRTGPVDVRSDRHL